MHAGRRAERGQILIIFVLALLAMFATASLLFDAGNALVRKRQLQDAGDAAALAAANVIQSGTTRGCSTTASPPGAPRPEVRSAAQTAVTAALPGFDTTKIVVTCPDLGMRNYAVQVDLSSRSPMYFGGVVGFSGFGVGTTSQAVNGQVGSLKYSVVELDPSHLDPSNPWPQAYRGCPSVLFSGSNTAIFDGAMQVDSACPAGNGGALGTNGNSAVVQFNNGAGISLVGGFAPGALTLTPTPQTGQPPVKDPLGLSAFQWGPGSQYPTFPVQSNKQTTLNNGSQVLEPGVYTGGIAMKNQAIAYLHPGIYVMNGGGFSIGGGNAVYSIPASKSSTTDAAWSSDCTITNCGVLIFNTNLTSTKNDVISVGAGATLKLRPYLPSADLTGANVDAYRNLLLWQDGSPAPTSSWVQPPISLSGGGVIDISGTLYAPSAIVQMGGNSGGSGGSQVSATLQFISWDLQFNGNIGFHFFYQSQAFAQPTDYGLIK